ncbi:transcriptional regulator, PaaX family [Shewanella woodyi ATCC 51908]|uniref:Transcriptional regulator, PaaX family n=2 Tax=Shewanella woodyi TaxID=60961 RepID=B1KMA4_SHEWM|nr:transcriptional regulator, PaaX family [Shewanella woodyi ATCC 51908]
MASEDNYLKFINQRVEKSSSGPSMLVTLFGDLVSQHGNWIWLGSLITGLKPFGYSERLIRTSVFRLVKSDWLITKKVGRRTYYALSETAKAHHDKAARRIYSSEPSSLADAWTVVIPIFVPDNVKETFKKQLQWLGFSPLTNGAYAHLEVDKQSLEDTLLELGLKDAVIVLSCKVDGSHSKNVFKRLVKEYWGLETLEASYKEFLDAYRPLIIKFNKGKMPSDETCFLLRILLIHEYRRILLKDKQLPEDMLPNGWVGFEAHELVGKLYAQLAQASVNYAVENLENAQGHLPYVSAKFWQRFLLNKLSVEP